MKTYVHHNPDGSIISLITLKAPEGAGIMLTPKPGKYVKEIAEILLKGKLSEFDELRQVIETHKISPSHHISTLTKK